ncbi:unnamed protein product [Rotaria magnacalcarata]
MNSTTSNIISCSLLAAPYQLNIWFDFFLWITGNIGGIGNMIVFRSRFVHKRAYSIYLFSSAVADFHYFNFELVTRIIQNGFGTSLMNRYIAICKLRQFSTTWSNVVSFSSFSFAILDRILSKQRSNIMFSSLSPAIAMSILVYLLISDVRGVFRRRIAPTNNILSIVPKRNSIVNQINIQITSMLILESFIAIIAYVPYSLELIYSNITKQWDKTGLRLAWEKLFIEFNYLFIFLLIFATSFYVSVLLNVGFRRKVEIVLGMETFYRPTYQITAFRRT